MTQETLEEAAEWLYPIFDRFKYDEDWVEDVTKRRDDFIKGAKWQQERSYSEGEVIDLLQEMNDYPTIFEGRIDIKEWFEQLKKK